MERRGFHGYQKPQSTSSGLKLSDINMKLAEVNNNKINATNGNNNNNNNNNNGTSSASDENECTVREQDRFMPIANVIRIMRKILPAHAKISDDAKETIQECVSEYISFITGEANERCQREQRKTITAEDVLWAMSKLGFDDYIEPLTVYLHRFREMEGDRGGSMRTETLIKTTTSAGTRAMTAAEYHHAAAAAAAAAGSLGFAPYHHHGFFGYLKDASSVMVGTINGDGAGTSSPSSQQAHFANAVTPVANGDHQAM